MSECNWLTVEEMTLQSSLILMWKTLKLEAPRNMYEKLHLDNENFLIEIEPRIVHTMYSWRLRTTVSWNCLPDELRGMMTLQHFKKGTKKWIVEQRALRQREPD